ncbi:MAG: porin [Nitrospinae bacterium]|nr:porin [Nitrospinota bacterium]
MLLVTVFPGFATAGDDELLDVLLKNGTLTRDQYETLQKKSSHPRQKPLKKGLVFESPDENFSIRIGGRVMVDGAWFADDKQDLNSGTELRRARIFIVGRLYKDWGFKGQYDFASNAVVVKDAFISYRGFNSTVIRIGHFKESFSLEEMSSSKYTTFMERALPNIFAPGRNLGVGFMTHGEDWTFAGGAFGEDVGTQRSDDEGYGISGRATFAPWHSKTEALHLGLSVAFRQLGDDAGGKQFSARPEAHISSVRLVDTGVIPNVRHLTNVAVEAAWVGGPFSLQGEYIWSSVDRKKNQPYVNFKGAYAYASWFLTGESRNYSARNGVFGRVRPLKNAGEGGIGAWEAAVRYSHLDLNDAPVSGGEENNITFGLNWYVNPRIRFMANYILVNTDTKAGNDDPEIFQFRAQVDF